METGVAMGVAVGTSVNVGIGMVTAVGWTRRGSGSRVTGQHKPLIM